MGGKQCTSLRGEVNFGVLKNMTFPKFDYSPIWIAIRKFTRLKLFILYLLKFHPLLNYVRHHQEKVNAKICCDSSIQATGIQLDLT